MNKQEFIRVRYVVVSTSKGVHRWRKYQHSKYKNGREAASYPGRERSAKTRESSIVADRPYFLEPGGR